MTTHQGSAISCRRWLTWVRRLPLSSYLRARRPRTPGPDEPGRPPGLPRASSRGPEVENWKPRSLCAGCHGGRLPRRQRGVSGRHCHSDGFRTGLHPTGHGTVPKGGAHKPHLLRRRPSAGQKQMPAPECHVKPMGLTPTDVRGQVVWAAPNGPKPFNPPPAEGHARHARRTLARRRFAIRGARPLDARSRSAGYNATPTATTLRRTRRGRHQTKAGRSGEGTDFFFQGGSAGGA